MTHEAGGLPDDRLRLGSGSTDPTLAAPAQAAQVAHDYVTAFLASRGRAAGWVLTQLTSNLVEYAIRHQRGDLSMTLQLPSAEVVRVMVCDDGLVPSAQALRPKGNDASIRALNALSVSWGLGRGPYRGGVGIWAETTVWRTA